MGNLSNYKSLTAFERRVFLVADSLGSRATTTKGAARFYRARKGWRAPSLLGPQYSNASFSAAYVTQHYGRYVGGDNINARARYYSEYRANRVRDQGVFTSPRNFREVMSARHIFGPLVTDLMSARLSMSDVLVQGAAHGLGRPIDVDVDACYALMARGRSSIGGWWRYADEVFLCGVDEGRAFAHRVPSTIMSISRALDYMRPAIANRPGAYVQRQGDIWAIGIPRESLRADVSNISALSGTRHILDRPHAGRNVCTQPAVLHHTGGDHADVYLPVGYTWHLARSPRIDPHGRIGGSD